MSTKITLLDDAVKNAEGDAATIGVVVADPDLDSPEILRITAGADWFESEGRFDTNLRSFIENWLQNVKKKRSKNDKVDAGIDMVVRRAGDEINLDDIGSVGNGLEG